MPKSTYKAPKVARTKSTMQVKVRCLSFIVQFLANIVQSLSKLELMPNELFAQVLSNLDDGPDSIYTLLALSFVSKIINAKTKKANGEPIVDARAMSTRLSKATSQKISYKKWLYNEAAAKLEKNGFFRKRLLRLTCPFCGKRKDNSLSGFADNEFHRDRTMRICFQCVTLSRPDGWKVRGEAVFRCVRCKKYELYTMLVK